MKFFVRHGKDEIGPLTRDDVFAQLREGKLSASDDARTEEAEEWKPLMEVVNKSAAKVLFTVEQIAANHEALPPPVVAIDLLPQRPSSARQEVTSAGTGRKMIAIAAIGMAAAFAFSFFVFHQNRADTLPAPPLASRQMPVGRETPPLPAPAPPVSTPSPTAAVVASAPITPTPTIPTPAPSVAMATPAPVPLSQPVATPPPNAAPQAPAIASHQLGLPDMEDVAKSSLWVAETAPQPRAILLLVVDPKDKPESYVRAKDWQAFAQQNGLGLAAVSIAPKETKIKGKTVTASLHVNQGLGANLMKAVDSVWNQSLPLFVFGRYGAGPLGASLVQWNPHRVLAWGAYSNEWKEAPGKEKAFVPALIACDREGMQHSHEARDFFAKGRSLNKPWTWLCLNTPAKDRAAQVDQFFRDYLRDCLGGQIDSKSGIWASNENLRPMSKLDFMTKPGEASWLPDSQLVSPWARLIESSATAVGPATILQRSVATRNPKQPTLELYLRLPRSDGKKPIAGILAFCTWEKDQASILSKLDIQLDDKAVDLPGPAAMVRSIIRYAEEHRMAVLTWGTAEAWDNHVNTEELEREKQREFDRNFDLLANAWERGVKELSHEAGDIPADNILLYGMSRGAQWAHRLALRKPDYFLAVHVHIPSTFDKPTPEANRPLWLVTTGELEYGYERAQSFYRECESLGYPIIFKAIVGIGHQGSSIADTLGLKFFDYALSVKALREEYEKQHKSALSRLVKQNAGPWLKPFREPEYFGDFVNQECFPVAQADMVPKAFRVPLPNKTLADAWNH